MRYQWRSMPEMGCLPVIIFFVLAVACFPLAIVFVLIYGFFKDNEGLAQSASEIITILAIGFILVASPIITMLSFIKFGFKETMKDSWLLVVISIIEFVCCAIFVVCQYMTAKKLKNETPEEREARIKLEQEKEKQRLERIKQQRLNKPYSSDELHICNISLYDQMSIERRQEIRKAIRGHVSRGTNLSKETWEIYYYRIVENKKNTKS